VHLPTLPVIQQDIWYWLSTYKTLLSLLLFLFLFIGALGLFLWLRAQRRYAAHQDFGDEPPYRLPIKIARQGTIGVRPDFLSAIRRLHGREESERQRIHLGRTVAATIRQGGHTTLRFNTLTRPVEYLLLIDKHNDQNHEAQLFEFIYQHLLQQEVHAQRFFFNGTPHWCWDEAHPEGISLEHLQAQLPDARLLVLSNGYGFISPLSGDLESWTTQLAPWSQRALLTPAPLAGWNYREATLAQFFEVLPYSVEGLAQTVRYFEGLPTPRPRDWKYELGTADKPLQIDEQQLLVSLSQHFDSDALRWIAACAVYPELHWDLTLQLGEALSTPATPLLSFERVAALARLPWFRQGRIPDTLRQQLLDSNALSTADRQQVREAIVHVLEANIPDNPNSYANGERRLHLAINALLLTQVPKEKQQWLHEYRTLHAQGFSGDQVSIVEIDRQFNRVLDFPLPQRLRHFLFPDGRKVLGLRPRVPLLAGTLAATLVAVLSYLLPDPCPGQPKRLPDTPTLYCLSNTQDSLDFYALEINGYLQRMHLDSATQRADFVRQSFPASAARDSFFLHLRQLQWNRAYHHYALHQMDSARLLLNTPLPDTDLPSTLANNYRHLHGLASFFAQQRTTAEDLLARIDTTYLQQHVPNLYHLLTYDRVDSMQEGRIRVRRDNRYGFLDSLGQPRWLGERLPYEQALNYSNGRALVTRGTQQCFIDRNENVLECFTRLSPFQDPQSQRWGYQNDRGTRIIEPRFDSAATFGSEGIALVKIQNRYGFIRLDGSAILEPRYTNARSFRNGLAAVRTSHWGYLNAQGIEVIPPQYDEAGDFNSRNEATVRIGTRQFRINRRGDCVGGDCPLVAYRGTVIGPARDGAPTNTPLANVTVQIDGLSQALTTNTAGEFVFELPGNLSPSKRRVNLAKTGYTPSTASLEILDASRQPIRMQPLVLSLPDAPQVRLRGSVRDSSNGQPLAGVQVYSGNTRSSTDANGSYSLQLPSDPDNPAYLLTFEKDGFQTRRSTLRPNTNGLLPEQRLQPNPSPFQEPAMVSVRGGTFTMGCTSEQGSDCGEDEKPAHQVTVSDFAIGQYEVTQKEWREVMGTNPSYFKNCDNCPVEKVSWDDIQQFLTNLNAKTGKTYRLPTEAEWEYAARGGSSSRGYKYAGSNTLSDVAWYTDNSGSKTHPVGQKKANELGLYDMSGNVWEWCQDWYADYPTIRTSNPRRPSTGSIRVGRGGSWSGGVQYCRVAYRNGHTPFRRYRDVGFRLARTP